MRKGTAEEDPLVSRSPCGAGTESFEEFFVRERRPVLALALVLSRNRPEAEDIAQEAFVAVLASWKRVCEMEDPGAWVRRVVSNRCVSRFRRHRTERAWADRGAGLTGRENVPAVSGESVDVWHEVSRLPRRQAQVVALRYLHDMPRKEIAAVLQLSEETVKTHLERARAALAVRLGEEGDRYDH